MLMRGKYSSSVSASFSSSFSSSARAVAEEPSAIEDTDRFGGKECEKTNRKV
jgi:hypothetical protein